MKLVSFLILSLIGLSSYNLTYPGTSDNTEENQQKLQFIATVNLFDASINSINSLNSLIKKESYRNRIISFNNPTNSDLGFNLENEILAALKPIIEKTQKTNRSKFTSVISSLINNPLSGDLSKAGINGSELFSPIISIVSNLVLSERKVTREDLDSFLLSTSRYFIQYEKLATANMEFDHSMSKLKIKLHELQFDLREFLIDIATILNKEITRINLKNTAFEDILITHLSHELISKVFEPAQANLKYPTDGIKSSKEIVYNVHKLFSEYQKLYLDNYTTIRNIVLQSRDLGKTIDSKKIESSLKELDHLFLESKDADIINVRLNTLTERLRALTICEQKASQG